MRRFAKTDKVADLLQHAISNAILFELEEEKLRWVAITLVRVNKDIKIAEVFYSVIEQKTNREEIEELLEKNLYKIKKYLSSNLRLRQIPELKFIYDDTEEKASKIEKILDEIKKGSSDGE